LEKVDGRSFKKGQDAGNEPKENSSLSNWSTFGGEPWLGVKKKKSGVCAQPSGTVARIKAPKRAGRKGNKTSYKGRGGNP